MHIYLHQPDMAEAFLSFFLSVFHVFRNQLKLVFVQKIVDIMLNFFAQNNISLDGNGKHIEHFFNIFSFVAQQPGSSYKSLLPPILSLVLKNMQPFIIHSNNPDVLLAFYNFLHFFMVNNYKYFFKPNLIKQPNHDEEMEEIGHKDDFLNIMKIFGESFLKADIYVFKTNLETLESLNNRFKLYHKSIFGSQLLKPFIIMFLQVLLSKSKDIFQDEISTIIYNMASVDFEAFFTQHIPTFLSSCQGLDSNQMHQLNNFIIRHAATDLPSFTQSLYKFVNDVRYYQLSSQSQPIIHS